MTMNEPAIPSALATRLADDLPLQRPFQWNRKKWADMVHDVPDAYASLQTLPDWVDRDTIRDVVQSNLTPERVLGAFVPVLIWGGPGGYGPSRARRILTGDNLRSNVNTRVDDTIRDRLVEGAEIVRQSGPVKAFHFMNNLGKIKYLGGAFFTKWLAFSSMVDAIDGPDVAPILDKRVRDWIAEHTKGPQQISLSTTSTDDYRRYVSLLKSWGTPYGRSMTEVELAIFDLTRDRPAE